MKEAIIGAVENLSVIDVKNLLEHSDLEFFIKSNPLRKFSAGIDVTIDIEKFRKKLQELLLK